MQSNQWRSQEFAPEGRGSTGDWTPTAPQGAPRQAMGPCGRPGVPCRPGALQQPRPPTPASATRAPAAGQGTHSAPKGHSCIRSMAPATGQRPPRQVRGPLQQSRGPLNHPRVPRTEGHGPLWQTRGALQAARGRRSRQLGAPKHSRNTRAPKTICRSSQKNSGAPHAGSARNPATNPQTPIGSGAPKPARGASGPPGPPLGYASF